MSGAPAVNDISSVFAQALAQISAAKNEIAKVIIGQDDVVDQTLITLFAGGHVLLIGVPGLAKTLLVETIATVLGLNANRVQCTPDLMPADIIGSEVLEEDAQGKRSFRFIKGPVFTQLLMADEINRASPRTQSALLQSMQEKEVSISGQAHSLPKPFHVLATQNPIEQEGTYPLPEAQLDRFLMQVNVDYPTLEAEREVILKTTTNEMLTASRIMDAEELMDIQHLVRDMPVGESVVDMIVNLVRNLRPGKGASEQVNEYVTWAPGLRGSQGLMLAVRARALLEGRSAPIEEDVFALAAPVLRHRMALNFKARSQRMGLDTLIDDVAKKL
jgi:MoxR-like ATPase